MILHNLLLFIIFQNQNNILKKSYYKLMLKNRIIVKYKTILQNYSLDLFRIIRDINILNILKESITINYPKKVHSIPLRLHITSRRI